MPSVSPAGQAPVVAKELPRRPNMKGAVARQPKFTPVAIDDGGREVVVTGDNYCPLLGPR